jgi:hypothetical protein
MEKLIKHFEYRGVNFLVRVELKVAHINGIGGRDMHTVKSIAQESQFYITENCESKNLEETINRIIKRSHDTIDALPESSSGEEKFLISLGFEKEND